MSDSPILLTPGPLTTAIGTRRAMLRDWGSRDPAFIALTAELRERLLRVANGQGTHAAVPLQGSGTFIVEAAIATLVPPGGKLLVLVNGAYGERMVNIARRGARWRRCAGRRTGRWSPRASRRRWPRIPPSPMSPSCTARPPRAS